MPVKWLDVVLQQQRIGVPKSVCAIHIHNLTASTLTPDLALHRGPEVSQPCLGWLNTQLRKGPQHVRQLLHGCVCVCACVCVCVRERERERERTVSMCVCG